MCFSQSARWAMGGRQPEELAWDAIRAQLTAWATAGWAARPAWEPAAKCDVWMWRVCAFMRKQPTCVEACERETSGARHQGPSGRSHVTLVGRPLLSQVAQALQLCL